VTVALTMIVKNEADKIVRCFDAARPLIDSLVIIDTGSDDGTPDIIKKWAKQQKLPFTLGFQEWTNFAVNRTALLELGRDKADWLLMLDSDMVLHYPDPMPDLESGDSWHGRIRQGSLDYALPMLVRAAKPWSYVGVAHAYLACAEDFREGQVDGLWVEDHSSTTNAKIERDIEALSLEHARNPLDRRTVFYLAQSHEDLDHWEEAIHFYRLRAEMGGWDEEVYVARYRLGCLLTEHVSFAEAATVLLKAWEGKPSRIEALRALAGAATSVANKAAYPVGEKLFVGAPSYQPHDLPKPMAQIPRRTSGLTPDRVSAIIVTRGNVSLDPILANLPYDDIIVWDNSRRDRDLKVYGRYEAVKEAKHDAIFWVDDDVIFTAHERLLAEYDPGKVVVNMDQGWIDGAGYGDWLAMMGAGSICDKTIVPGVFDRYFAAGYPLDDEFLLEADFVFGTLAPFRRIDVGYDVREFADAPDRLYMQPGQTQRKHAMIQRCRDILAAEKRAA